MNKKSADTKADERFAAEVESLLFATPNALGRTGKIWIAATGTLVRYTIGSAGPCTFIATCMATYRQLPHLR